jgi:hypothetical protein
MAMHAESGFFIRTNKAVQTQAFAIPQFIQAILLLQHGEIWAIVFINNNTGRKVNNITDINFRTYFLGLSPMLLWWYSI